METTIKLPAIVGLHNSAAHAVSFQPYHENFTVEIPAGNTVAFEVETAGQFFYYQLQTKNSALEFTQLEKLPDADDTTVVIDLPSMVTLENVSGHAVAFRPYRENFDVEMDDADVIILEAKTAGQVLYYLSQAQVNKGIAVDFDTKKVEDGPTEG